MVAQEGCGKDNHSNKVKHTAQHPGSAGELGAPPSQQIPTAT